MLRELHISNLAVIADATVELAPGLNVFTGPTGAGKSLVLGAFELLLGLRSGVDMLRTGAEEGRVSGLFEVRDAAVAQAVATGADQPVGVGDELLITRKLFASGRTSVSINGQPATANMVRIIGQQLVDIHGQYDHQYLLRPSHQLEILDAFAGADDDRAAYAEVYERLRDLRQQREELATSTTLRSQQLELYEFQAAELDDADPQAGEFAELQARHDVLSNVARIQQRAGDVQAALYEADGAIVGRLEVMVSILRELGEIDEPIDAIAEQVRTATLTLQEASFELSRYLDRLEADPRELKEVEDRLNTLNRLISKYGERAPGSDPLQPVLTYREQIGREIEQLRGQAQDASQIDQRIAAAQAELEVIGRRLTKARTAAAASIKPLVEAQLQELGMADATFGFQITPAEEPGPTGADQVEMMVRTNPGQAERPLRKIASGGEMSRIMLAIKGILAGSDRISVLVFDEIDANIGGRLGSIIGRKMRDLTRAPTTPPRSEAPRAKRQVKKPATRATAHPSHQVLCITHLPQIAAFGDRHLHIRKSVSGKGKTRQTVTTVASLEGDQRIAELAEMMAGREATDTTRRQAEEMLTAAR